MVNEKSFALGLSIYHFINGYGFVFHYFHVLKLFIAPALPVPFSPPGNWTFEYHARK